MQFLALIVIFKIALTILGIALCALFIGEFFPILANKAVEASAGTQFAMFGEWLAQALNFIAHYANKLVNFIFGWLSIFGIDIDAGAVKDGVQGVDLEAPKEKPEF